MASEAESGGATEAKASDDPEDPGDAEASAAELDEADEGASPEGLEPTGDELAARMDAYLAANFPRAGAPGLAVAVVDAGGVRYLRTFGDCPDADAPFVVGSLSKSFTAVAVSSWSGRARWIWTRPRRATPRATTCPAR